MVFSTSFFLASICTMMLSMVLPEYSSAISLSTAICATSLVYSPCIMAKFVYDYCLAILGVDMLFDFRNVGHHLDVTAIDVDFDVVLAHGFNQNKVPDACPVA